MLNKISESESESESVHAPLPYKLPHCCMSVFSTIYYVLLQIFFRVKLQSKSLQNLNN